MVQVSLRKAGCLAGLLALALLAGAFLEGRADLECAAERAISVWMDQIESENGYTRACLVKSIAHFRVWCDKLMEQGGRTWEEISQSQVRGATHTLALFGYTPKWLDEFKNIPRHATSDAKQPGK